jgi:hypothetical protein
MTKSLPTVIPGRAVSAFTCVFDALWREPGIQMQTPNVFLDSGFTRFRACPGMTALHHWRFT